MFAGPLGSRLPFLPIDYLDVVRDLELTDLKLHWTKAKIKEWRESQDVPALRFPPSKSVRGKVDSFRYFGKLVLFVTRGGFDARYAELWFILHS